jgi:hypothetical protein
MACLKQGERHRSANRKMRRQGGPILGHTINRIVRVVFLGRNFAAQSVLKAALSLFEKFAQGLEWNCRHDETLIFKVQHASSRS